MMHYLLIQNTKKKNTPLKIVYEQQFVDIVQMKVAKIYKLKTIFITNENITAFYKNQLMDVTLIIKN